MELIQRKPFFDNSIDKYLVVKRQEKRFYLLIQLVLLEIHRLSILVLPYSEL